MARVKRTLEEADVNGGQVPPAKRASTGKEKAKGKENYTRSDVETGSNSSMAKQASSKTSKSSVIPKDKDGKVPHKADGNIWICVCRPTQDIVEENEIDEEDEEAIERLQTCGGFELVLQWQTEQSKRDQDNFNMHIFNNFSGYGTVEVMQNILLAFDKEFKKKTKDPLAIWSQMEGLAMFLNGDLQLWEMIDDAEGNAKLVSIIGVAILSTIDLLVDHDVFMKDSSTVRNLGLILSHFLKFAHSQNDTCQHNENGWAVVVINRANEHSVTIQGMTGIDDIIQSVRDDLDCTNGETSKMGNDMTIVGTQRMRMWKSWDRKKEFGRYSKTQGVKVGLGGSSSTRIGGNFYDLTAKQYKGPHMERYMLGGGSDDENSM